MADHQNLHSQPDGSATFASAVAARPDLHPARAILSALAGPKPVRHSPAELREMLERDMAFMGVAADDPIGRSLVAQYRQRIRDAEWAVRAAASAMAVAA